MKIEPANLEHDQGNQRDQTNQGNEPTAPVHPGNGRI